MCRNIEEPIEKIDLMIDLSGRVGNEINDRIIKNNLVSH